MQTVFMYVCTILNSHMLLMCEGSRTHTLTKEFLLHCQSITINHLQSITKYHSLCVSTGGLQGLVVMIFKQCDKKLLK